MPRPKSRSDSTGERLVINTGPLIALSKARALDIAAELPYRFICPEQVYTEFKAGAEKGYHEIAPSWLEVRPLERPLDLVARAMLDAAEAAVIQLAQECDIRRVCLDERRARRAASAAGLEVVGTLGLLLRAKNLGIISALRPVVDRMRQGGDWFDERLIEEILKAAGEAGQE